jgi:hypothetical protein
MAGNFEDLWGTTWTIEFWVRTPTWATFWPPIVSFMNPLDNSSATWFKVRVRGDGSGQVQLEQQQNTNLITSSAGLTTNTWHHVAFVRNGSTITVYQNGASTGSNTVQNYNSMRFNTIGIGVDYNASTHQTYSSFFDGDISQVHVSRRALYTSAFTPKQNLFPADISQSMFFLGTNGYDFVSGRSLDIGTSTTPRNVFML